MNTIKTLLKINKDNYNDIAYSFFVDEINYLVNELNVFCEQNNENYFNIVEREKDYYSDKEDYSNFLSVQSTGYSQGDHINYKIYYNDSDLKDKEKGNLFNRLKEILGNSFTHYNNQYSCSLFEYAEIDGGIFINKEAFDIAAFAITNIEFPEEKDVLNEYRNCFGENYDKIEININL